MQGLGRVFKGLEEQVCRSSGGASLEDLDHLGKRLRYRIFLDNGLFAPERVRSSSSGYVSVLCFLGWVVRRLWFRAQLDVTGLYLARDLGFWSVVSDLIHF